MGLGRRFPVICLSFDGGVIRDRVELDESLNEALAEHKQRLGVHEMARSLFGRFYQCIRLAYEYDGGRTVVLIGE